MEHGARLSTTRVIGLGFICLGTVTVLSLATNVIQGINNYRLQNEQKVAVTPMLYNAPFAVSQNQSDASYLEQMGLSFVSLRLNVTPETVDDGESGRTCSTATIRYCPRAVHREIYLPGEKVSVTACRVTCI